MNQSQNVVGPMENFLSTGAVWLVPLVLVLLKFTMKLVVGERTNTIRFWENLLQSPIDIGFLALSFAASMTLTRLSHAPLLFTTCLLFVLLLMISVVLWKVSPAGATRKEIVLSGSFLIINYGITIPMLVYSISILTKG